ncbi:hypothetical protein ACKTEK_11175 [Tepidamorphus sp. 3E244]|uniref:hypothetical protein n=1 Tax=Tepidamorphus sp. 3E244 TaxID=3385498 RepID=UPI0038FC8329
MRIVPTLSISLVAAALSVGAMAATPASDATRPAEPAPLTVAAPSGKNVPCTCRYQGRDFHQGESICIRGELAQCGMYLNNTSWKFTKTPCPMARLGATNTDQ